MNNFKIEKNVPAPKLGDGWRKYPFPEMSVGDSIFFDASCAGTPAKSATVFGRKQGWKFISRSENGGIRVWRTA